MAEQPPQTDAQQPSRPTKRRRILRIALIAFALLLVAAIVLLMFAPAILSTDAGREWALARINARLAGRVDVAQLTLSWSDPLEAGGVLVTNADGHEAIRIDRIDCPIGLYGLLLSDDPIGQVQIEGVEITLAPDADGRYGLGDIAPPKSRPSPPRDWRADLRQMATRKLEVAMVSGLVRFNHADGTQDQIRDITFDVAPTAAGSLHFSTEGRGLVEPAAVGTPGVLRVTGDVDATEPGAYRHAGKLQVLQDVSITPEVSTTLLSRINPAVFYSPQAIEGQVSLTLTDVDIPLSGDILAGANIVAGRLDLAGLKIRPRTDSVLGRIFSFGVLNVNKFVGAETPGVDFYVRDGRVYYENFEFIWNGVYRTRFSGSVGADNTVDLNLHLPVTTELVAAILGMEQLPPTLRSLAAGLEGADITIAIAGTRHRPTFDLLSARQSILDRVRQSVPVRSLIFDGIGKAIRRRSTRDSEPADPD